jgi:hypothetical protein
MKTIYEKTMDVEPNPYRIFAKAEWPNTGNWNALSSGGIWATYPKVGTKGEQ